MLRIASIGGPWYSPRSSVSYKVCLCPIFLSEDFQNLFPYILNLQGGGGKMGVDRGGGAVCLWRILS